MPRLRPATSIPDEVWATHKEKIRGLYIDSGLKLQDVMDKMEVENRFTATIAQYRIQLSEWKFHKNKRKRASGEDVEEDSPRRHTNPAFNLQHVPTPMHAESSLDMIATSQPVLGATAMIDFAHISDVNMPFNFHDLNQSSWLNMNQPSQSSYFNGMSQSAYLGGPQTYSSGLTPLSSQVGTPVAQIARQPTAREAPVPRTPSDSISCGSGNNWKTRTNIDKRSDSDGNDSIGSSSNDTSSNDTNSDDSSTSDISSIHSNSGSSRNDNYNSKSSKGYKNESHDDGDNSKNSEDGSEMNNSNSNSNNSNNINGKGGNISNIRRDSNNDRSSNASNASNIGGRRRKNGDSVIGNNNDNDNENDNDSDSGRQDDQFSNLVQTDKKDAKNSQVPEIKLPIHMAASYGNLPLVIMILENEPRCVNAPDGNGFTPLMTALHYKQTEVAEFLLERQDVDVTVFSQKYQWSALHCAVTTEKISLVERLIKRGVEIDLKDENGSTPLSLAATLGNVAIVKLILDHGANYNTMIKGPDGLPDQPIHLAMAKGHIGVVNTLLQAGADLDSRKVFDNTQSPPPLGYIAASGGSVAIGELLLERGESLDATFVSEGCSFSSAHVAATNNHASYLNFLIEHKVAVDRCDENGTTPLHSAVSRDRYETTRILLDAGVAADIQNGAGTTPLILAAEYGSIKTAQLLLDAGASVNLSTDTGATALMCAAKTDKLKLVELLLAKGGSVNAQDKFGFTALMVSIQKKNTAVADALIKAGADVSIPLSDGFTPLMYACFVNFLEGVCLLIRAGANVDVCSKKGFSAMMVAASAGYIDIMARLHLANAKIYQPGVVRQSIHFAARGGHLEAVKFLVEKCGDDVNRRDGIGNTPMCFTCMGAERGRVELVQYLLGKGANLVL